MTVVTRFAPSPTGFLHIGGARTALFNWLYARHCGGKFLLRIEDTDKKRSTDDAKAAILDGLSWLELDWDGDVVYQSTRANNHAAAAQRLLDDGNAYHCYCTPDELAAMREAARAEGRPTRYDGRWRDRDPAEAPAGVPPVIRLKAPRDGETVIADAVQGDVRVANEELDDMILLRADGTPTYMLSVVVDDHDMGISHVIRGDDHLTNAFRQSQLFRALGWEPPTFAHIPLIHGPDGAKLSKRHGALGVDAYRDMGFLPEAVRNYLLRLGWSHGDDEIIGTEQAIAWFDLPAINKAAARFDLAKLTSLNAHYLRKTDDSTLRDKLRPRLNDLLVEYSRRENTKRTEVSGWISKRVKDALSGLKPRARTLEELAEAAWIFVEPRPILLDNEIRKDLLIYENLELLIQLKKKLEKQFLGVKWEPSLLEKVVRDYADKSGIKFGKIAQPLRGALTGRTKSPGIFDVMIALGKTETLHRISDVVKMAKEVSPTVENKG